ncbi:hypothetical protein K438DRAFT_1846912 [Mycena galopus ATCC 62051]|nr:hypothetical protein K438DRAFT_1846912 [Mycena galopus ATCC 62051]
MSTDSTPFFPPELEREIFETAACLYPERIDTLILVSHRTYDWVTRIKYNIVVTVPSELQSYCPFHVLQRGIQSNSKSASFFRDRVRHLFIPHGNTDELRAILSVCTKIQTLAILLRAEPIVFRDLTGLRPRRLSIRLVPLLLDTDLCRPTFTLVTHLLILDFMPIQNPSSDINMDRWLSFLSSLPSLTHLAAIAATRVASDILVSCKTLEVLVHLDNSWGPYPPEADELMFVDDDRFVYMVVDWDYSNDWATGTEGGMDFWARADAFLAMKRRGEIKPDTRCWIETGDGV